MQVKMFKRICKPTPLMSLYRIRLQAMSNSALNDRPPIGRSGYARLERLFNFHLGERTLLGAIGVLYRKDRSVFFINGGDALSVHRLERHSDFKNVLLEHGLIE